MVRIPGSHAPNIKNRSSKQNICLTKVKPAVRSMSNAALAALAGKDVADEIRRRNKKHSKKA